MMIVNWRPELDDDNPEKYISGNIDIIIMLEVKEPEVLFEPKEKWAYSNTGYVLLATIVERASGKPFEEFLRERIFEPVGMQNTNVYSYVTGKDQKMPMCVFGFTPKDGKFTSNDTHFLNFAKGDGGINSTLEDLWKWDRILYTDKLVSEETIKTIFSPAKLNNCETTDYGYGWFIEDTPLGNKLYAMVAVGSVLEPTSIEA
tara:strand:+ start:14237 stop:14842 length:606 start_codon:yes stop_codon:yes gene_type:complete